MSIKQSVGIILVAWIITLINSWIFCYGWNHFVVAINFVLAQHVENSASIITAVFIPQLSVPIVFGIVIMKSLFSSNPVSITISTTAQLKSYFAERLVTSLFFLWLPMYITTWFI